MTKAEKAEKDKRDLEVSRSILSWIEENNVFSFYDCYTHAYNNDFHDWIKHLKNRNYRFHIKTYLKSRKESLGGVYLDSRIEAEKRMIKAREEYYRRNKIPF